MSGKVIFPTDVPIVGQTVFVVCARGHVNEAPNHPGAAFREQETGNVLQAVFCARCMFDFNVAAFGGMLLPRETTRKEAEWKAKALKAQAEHVPGNVEPEPS